MSDPPQFLSPLNTFDHRSNDGHEKQILSRDLRQAQSSEKDDDHATQPRSSNSPSPDIEQQTLTQIKTHVSRLTATKSATRITTCGTTFTSDPAYEVDFAPDDPGNPRNWPPWYKGYAMFTVAFGTLGVAMYSSGYTAATDAMMEAFGEDSSTIVTLGLTTYLFGLAIGSLLLAPLAETYGRSPVYIISMAFWAVLIIPAATAQNLRSIIAVRFVSALFGSAMIANSPGSIADMFDDDYRATALSIWSIGPMNGPIFGPIMNSYVAEYLGWRWTNWLTLIWGAVALVLCLFLKETYAPVLLQKRAKKLRTEHDDSRYWSRFDSRISVVELMKIALSRPFLMAFKEPMLIFWNFYIALVYGNLYLCFVAYPIVFGELRGWSVGTTGLSYLGIGIGITILICMASPIRKMVNAHKPDQDGHVPPEAQMSIVCIGAVLIPVGQLWFAWTCYPTSIHWAIPLAAGIPFGFGNTAIFIYATNYLAYSYGIYAASALASNTFIRSMLGGLLPLAGPSMYSAMGPNWAGTVLGLFELVILPLPFVFHKYGARIREKSATIREMRENEERQERKRRHAEERLRVAVQSGNPVEAEEARVDLLRVRSRMDEDRDLEGLGHETLNTLHGLGREPSHERSRSREPRFDEPKV